MSNLLFFFFLKKGVLTLQVIVTDQFEIVVKNGILASFGTFVLLKIQTHFLQ